LPAGEPLLLSINRFCYNTRYGICSQSDSFGEKDSLADSLQLHPQIPLRHPFDKIFFTPGAVV